MERAPAFELIPIPSDDPRFLDRLIESNAAFRRLLKERRRERDEGRVSSLEAVHERSSTGMRRRRQTTRYALGELLDFSGVHGFPI